MTNTNEDRVRAFVAKLRNDGISWAQPMFDSAATELEALLSDKQALERENERLNDRNVEVSMLAHQWMVAHDNRTAGLPVTYPSPADAPASLFLLALMAACAETTYRAGFKDAERVTDERHIDYLRGNAIAGIAAAMSPDRELEASLTAAQERVEELEKGVAVILRDFADKTTPEIRDVCRALLTPTPRIQQGPGIGGGVS
jgi:hypothetical protein